MKIIKKQILLFEASILVNILDKKAGRSGIFFVAYNILKELERLNTYNIILLFDCEQYTFVKLLKKKKYYEKFKYVIHYNKEIKNKYIYNIFHHKENIKNCKNPIIIFITLLKIFKNILILTRNKILFENKSIKIFKKASIFLSPQYHLPEEFNKYYNIKQYVILYDVIPILLNNYNNDPRYHRSVKYLNKNTYYLCISDNTKNDFIKYYSEKLDKNKMFVTYIASAQTFFPNYDKNNLKYILNKYNIKYSDNNKYLFSLCTLAPHKNLVFTVKCFIKFIKKNNINNLLFYFGGGDHWSSFIEQLKNNIDNFNEYSDKIIKIGYIDDEDLNILYSNSLFFTFLSQYEGFGMPPLEAMQAGTPVITSNNSSIPEVVGDAGIMIDYNNEEQCIKALEDLYFNEKLRNNYIIKGVERAKLFSWEKTVGKINNIVKNTKNAKNSNEPIFVFDKKSIMVRKIVDYELSNKKIKNMIKNNEIITLNNKSKIYLENICKKIKNDKEYKYIKIPFNYSVIKNPFFIEKDYNVNMIYCDSGKSIDFNSVSPAIFPVVLKSNTLYKVECEIIKNQYIQYVADFYAGPCYDLPECESYLEINKLLANNKYAYINSNDTKLAGNNQIYLRIFFYGQFNGSSVKNVKIFELLRK